MYGRKMYSIKMYGCKIFLLPYILLLYILLPQIVSKCNRGHRGYAKVASEANRDGSKSSRNKLRRKINRVGNLVHKLRRKFSFRRNLFRRDLGPTRFVRRNLSPTRFA